MSTSKYSRLDSDSERLPENMTRIGYDADTERYQYQDSTDGSYWEGPPGSQYGVLRPVGWVDPRSDEERLLASEQQDKIMEETARQDWRMLLPFFLLCGVFLLGIWWVVGGWGLWDQIHGRGSVCSEKGYEVKIRAGDTCWGIAGGKAEVLERLKELNEGVDCDKLGVGDVVCLPGGSGG